jgi:transcriptional regulator with XRE-family HTH domain
MSNHSVPPSVDEFDSQDPDLLVVQRMVTILKEARLSRKFTLRQIAGEMKIDNTHLSRCERGLVQPGLIVLLRWCRALDLRADDLLKDSLNF